MCCTSMNILVDTSNVKEKVEYLHTISDLKKVGPYDIHNTEKEKLCCYVLVSPTHTQTLTHSHVKEVL